MNIRVYPSSVSGIVNLPLSKSFYHREIIVKAITNVPQTISDSESLDIKATYYGIKELLSDKNEKVIDCNESGTTLRLLIPIALAIGGNFIFTGVNKLKNRDLTPYFDCFKDDPNVSLKKVSQDNLPLQVSGKLSLDTYTIDSSRSSQFISGMLIGLSLLKNKIKLNIINEVVSKKYIDITLKILDYHKVSYEKYPNYYILGGSLFNKAIYSCEKDFSQAAFFLSLSLLTKCPLSFKDVSHSSLQGDFIVLTHLKELGLKSFFKENYLFSKIDFKVSNNLIVDLKDIPDLGPILMLTGIFCKTNIIFTNCDRLLDKESNRLDSVIKVLNILEVDYTLTDDFTFRADKYIEHDKLYTFDSYNDHRIAMSLFVISTILKQGIILNNVECIDKSYPKFLSDMGSIGVKYEQIG